MATRADTPPVAESDPGGKDTVKAASGSSKRRGRGAATVDLPAFDHEEPWTQAELDELRRGLESERDRLRGEVDEAEHELVELMRDFGDGAGDDQADAGAATWEREQELSLANNARGLLEQAEHALQRIDSGSYGVCESCGNPIGKMRLRAFPRATLCMSCKQKQERR